MLKTNKALLTAICLVTCAILFVVSGGISSVAAQEPPSYELVCRGGGGMVGQYKASGGEHVFHASFRRAGQGADEAQPGPGECAWPDRPVYGDEPGSLAYKTTGEGYVYLEINEGRTSIADASPRIVRDIIDAISGGRIFRVMCYNDGNALRITGKASPKR